MAYVLMSVLLYMHTVGGHYTFERVPFGFVTNLFGFERNHYDRVAHFSVGFYAFAIAEALVRAKAVRSRLVLFLFPVFTIAFVAMGYELIEWWYAAAAGGTSGAAFLGSCLQMVTPESGLEVLLYFDAESCLCITADAIIDNRDELRVR
jgi:putative membrane protein